MGGDGGDHKGVQLGGHDRAPGRQVVGGGPGRGGHDEPVGGVGGEQLAGDRQLQAHHVGARRADHGLVHGVAQHTRRPGRRVQHHLEQHPLLHLVLAPEEPVEGMVEGRGLDLGEVAEMTDVHPEHGYAVAADQVDGPQHGSVAAQAHGQVEAGRQRLVGHRPLLKPGGGGVGQRHPAGVAQLLQPGDGPLGQVGCLSPLVVRQEGDVGHLSRRRRGGGRRGGGGGARRCRPHR